MHGLSQSEQRKNGEYPRFFSAAAAADAAASAVSAGGATVIAGGNGARREKLIDREGYAVKQLAGILRAAGAEQRTLTRWDAIIVHRDQQLRVAFETHRGELPERNAHTAAKGLVEDDRLIECGEDPHGHAGK